MQWEYGYLSIGVTLLVWYYFKEFRKDVPFEGNDGKSITEPLAHIVVGLMVIFAYPLVYLAKLARWDKRNLK